MYQWIRPWLFRQDAETVHGVTLRLLRWSGNFVLSRLLLQQLFVCTDPRLEVELFGLRFLNRVGLAAGYDKNGSALGGLACLGFGHLEVGTVTRCAQVGNPRPRVHRVPEADGVINSMGFPNDGVDRLQLLPPAARNGVRIGVNIGKSKQTPLERAAEDYCALLEQVYRRADYVAINVSSPNTPQLRQLQTHRALAALLSQVTGLRDRLTPRLPILVKIAPDLSPAEIDDVLAAVSETGVDGIIATNTTVGRGAIPAKYQGLPGGLSGTPLRAQATAVVRHIAQRTEGRLPIIGVGGIMCAGDALARLEAGAQLVQLYTGLVYTGPGLVRQINQLLLKRTA